MPFQSEKQRRYLWANEPEIAREWTDRYGAADGGITRIGFRRGNPHSDGGSRAPSSGPHGGNRSAPSRSNQGPPGGGDRQMTYTAPVNRHTGPSNQEALKEGARRKAIRDEIARQQAEKQDHIKRSLWSRITGGLGNLIRGAGNVVNPITLLSGGANLVGQEGIAKMLAGLNLGKGAVGFNKYNNQNVNDFNNLGPYTNRMNEKYEDEGRIGDYWREGIETVDTEILPESRPLNVDEVFDERTLMAGNYSQNAVANQMLGVNYDVLDPFQQHQINDAINTYGTTSLGTIKT